MRVPLLEALSDLRDIVEAVEFAGGEVSDSLLPVFNRTVENLTQAIDRRVFLLKQIDAEVELLSEAAAQLLVKKRMLEKIKERVKALTADAMRRNPDLEFRGNLGRFRIVANGGLQPLEYRVKLETISHVVSPSDVYLFPPNYVDKLTVFQLKKQEFEADLRAGLCDCDAANLREKGEHVRYD